jgi:hypothetical protein
MSKPSKLPKNRYELAYHSVLNALPTWKKVAVIEDTKNQVTSSRALDEFSKAVIELAESDKEILLTADNK